VVEPSELRVNRSPVALLYVRTWQPVPSEQIVKTVKRNLCKSF
jgi:hypothetical protein